VYIRLLTVCAADSLASHQREMPLLTARRLSLKQVAQIENLSLYSAQSFTEIYRSVAVQNLVVAAQAGPQAQP